MQGRRNLSSEILSTAMLFVLFLTMLLFVIFAAVSYRSAVSSQERNGEERALLSYITTAVKADQTDQIVLENVNGTDTLIISDGQSGMEQRIFFRDGKLLENYGMKGYDFQEGDETVIGEADYFEMKMIRPGLLEIKTDKGFSYINTNW